MATSKEFSTRPASVEPFIVTPDTPELLTRALEFGTRMQENADLLTNFFEPNFSATHHQLPFGPLGDGTLNVVIDRSNPTAQMSIGYRGAEGDDSKEFYASGDPNAIRWRSNGDTYLTPRAVAKRLDANWPSFFIDNAGVRELMEKENGLTFGDIFALLDSTAQQYGTPRMTGDTFVHSHAWKDFGEDAMIDISLTRGTVINEPNSYALTVSLPYWREEYQVKNVGHTSRTDPIYGIEVRNLECTARTDPIYGIVCEFDTHGAVVSPDTTCLATILPIFETYLEMLVASRTEQTFDTLDIDSFRQ